jgi:hypothetical protein
LEQLFDVLPGINDDLIDGGYHVFGLHTVKSRQMALFQ